MNKTGSLPDMWVSHDDRVEFYLNNLKTFEIDIKDFNYYKSLTKWSKIELNLVSYNDYKNSFAHWYCQHIVHLPRIKNIRVLPFYKRYKDLHSLMNFFIPFDKAGLLTVDFKYPLYYGEHGSSGEIPAIRKSRRATDQHSVIYNFRSLRLTDPCTTSQANDLSWREKKDNVIWRGATTGQEQRVDFVKNYYNKYDVGFATTKQKPELTKWKRGKVTIKKQLEYKFIISLEGNDVASNLRWILSSNSVPIMPKPYWQSWIMEEKLEPYVHYLPLKDDLSDLEQILEWTKQNDQLCAEIAQNGRKYMSQFLDEQNDMAVQKLLLETYAQKVSIKY
ncbi:Glycosyl transferase family 90 [Reichenbachiella agariperforans]|uniref:Glycosyl transferase family 90 n=2 Tax=Reichenbachiella agariperforans TaxID=156994 RepID=A0A1M6V055_REIAG|nr:Glycosyl transferase family 90 [Reichenbachiella agariperforans]